MSEHVGEVRKRGQNLLVVEGNHEKNKLFWLIFKCFSEINIDMDDIDLPFVISKKKQPNLLRSVSKNAEKGYIWVLNTCVFFVAEYNFALINK